MNKHASHILTVVLIMCFGVGFVFIHLIIKINIKILIAIRRNILAKHQYFLLLVQVLSSRGFIFQVILRSEAVGDALEQVLGQYSQLL